HLPCKRNCRCPRTVEVGKRWPCLDILRRTRSRKDRTTTWCRVDNRDDGEPSRDRLHVLRPFLSQSGHDATWRLRQFDRASPAKEGPRKWQQRICRWRLATLR